jgi:hypothetical protein
MSGKPALALRLLSLPSSIIRRTNMLPTGWKMHFRFKIRFQSWVMLMTALLVASLAVAFLFTVFQTFSRSAEEAANERFLLVAQQASRQVQESIERSQRFVALQTRSAANQFVVNGKLNREAKVPLFLAAIEADPNVCAP